MIALKDGSNSVKDAFDLGLNLTPAPTPAVPTPPSKASNVSPPRNIESSIPDDGDDNHGNTGGEAQRGHKSNVGLRNHMKKGRGKGMKLLKKHQLNNEMVMGRGRGK